MKASAGELQLPEGSKVESGQQSGFLSITTGHSTVHFNITSEGEEIFDNPQGITAKLIEANLVRMGVLPFDENSNGWLHMFGLEVTSTQNAFKRYSKKAKIENEQLRRIHSQITPDFSFEYLKSNYETMAVKCSEVIEQISSKWK